MKSATPEWAARRQQVIELVTGHARPAFKSRPVLSSAPTPVEGMLLEHHTNQEIDSRNIINPHHCCVLHLAQEAEFEMKVGSQPMRSVLKYPGHINFVPAQTPVTVVSRNSGDFLMLTMEPQFFFFATHDMTNPDQLELIPQQGLKDPFIEHTIRNMLSEFELGNPGGRIYAESMATSLALHMALRYASTKVSPDTAGRGLPTRVLRVVVEYIEAHLPENISLRVLADVAGLSTFHFARLFRASTGLSPHRFIVQNRVDRARDMLRHNNRSIAEVALAVGFCDQSHFAMHFKRRCGKTPRAYQLEMASQISRS